MIRTRVGYAGGSGRNPTYHSLGDHTETVQVDYDPSKISYEKLLQIFWSGHNPTQKPWSRQYMSVIFYHDDKQKRLAAAAMAGEEKKRGQRIYTEIAPFTGFYLAENYHQKYRLRQEPELFREYEAIYPDAADFVSSTATARVNGYLGGYGAKEVLEKELDGLGLSQAGKKALLDMVSRSHRRSVGCPL